MTELLTMMGVYLTQAVLTFPEWSPALVSFDLGFIGLGEFHLRWYALGYIAGIGGAWWYGSQLLKRESLWGGKAPLNQDGLDDLMFWIIIGIILGGRLGYVLFYMVPYQMETLAADPLTVIRIWDGGMAFHGGILGVAVVLWFFAAKRGVRLLSVGDIAGVTAPIGIGLVRIANFTNAELYGRHTDAPVGMVFPEGYVPGSTPPAFNWDTDKWVYAGNEMARHPSQLYESVLEGWLPLIVLSILIWKFGALKRPGLVAGLFLIMYGVGRSVAENFREPDAFVSGLPEWLTMGMILSVPMWVGGAWLIWNALKQKEKRV
ncbi:prolipoprotein diacylglyceryl transferase [Hyphomonas sp.]|uniref:prolipoprotein diacylglyceryl transferase n=1 Tax=Hyphomonas sp. TaxID=87 RepID=UPI0025B85D46|nr:prolipoprotein diacylglyceryl transferase [Hyphomonas sp.]